MPTAAQEPPLLDIRDVTKVFQSGHRGEVTAAAEVCLVVASGEIVGVVGESGAGKSTLGRLVLGLERPDTGEIRFEGDDLTDLRGAALRAARRRMHLVLQDPYQSLHPGMRVATLVTEPLAIRGADHDEQRILPLRGHP